jgi:hypothetical protein
MNNGDIIFLIYVGVIAVLGVTSAIVAIINFIKMYNE